MQTHHHTKVAVALSGGVDSAVAAYLLKKQGFRVVGVFMKNYESPKTILARCSWKEDQESAERVAKKLKIPFETWNFERLYESNVLNPFYRGLEKGITLNPDIACNKQIKFGAFYYKALHRGFDAIATGHYAAVEQKGKHFFLKKPVDKKKDQTYFLSSVSERQLAKTFFPLRGLVKEKVRRIAKKIKLPNAQRPDSQGICFVGEVSMSTFLQDKVKHANGPILTVEGKRIGMHQGLPFYTIGQREGLRIGGLPEPYYIVKKDVRTNSIIVDTLHSKNSKLFTKRIICKPIHWITRKEKLPLVCYVSFRYRQKPIKARILLSKHKIVILPTVVQRAITPGQFAVLYKNAFCLGNAEIISSL